MLRGKRAIAADAEPRILLVEDDASIAQMERLVLERSGFRVKDVQKGEHALECLASGQQIDLMILDYMLPDMTGADIVAVMGDRIAYLPVIVVSGCIDPEITNRLLLTGVYECIGKDIGLEFLERLPKVAHAAIESQLARIRS